MNLAIMQPYFMPYLGYWQLMNCVDTFVLFDDVNFINKGYINRNNILLKGGPHSFSIPIQGASQNKKINELYLSDGNERKKILITISQGYKKSLNFDLIFPIISDIFNQESIGLVDFVENSIISVCRILEINTRIVKSSKIDLQCTGFEKIIPLCKYFDASKYINPVGGINLYEKKDFLDNGIDLKFIQMIPLEYIQLHKNFHPNMSILDLLFNAPKESWHIHLNSYELI